MSYITGVFKPTHPDADIDKEAHELQVASFAGPGVDHRWIQLNIDDKFIRLNPAQVSALSILLKERMNGTDKPSLEVS